MKWLATFLLLVTPALAQETLPSGTVQFPSSMVCGNYNPNLKEIIQEYGELPFLEGPGQVLAPDFTQAYTGKVRMFLNPKNGNFTLFIDIREEFTCMIVTGEDMKPILEGSSL